MGSKRKRRAREKELEKGGSGPSGSTPVALATHLHTSTIASLAPHAHSPRPHGDHNHEHEHKRDNVPSSSSQPPRAHTSPSPPHKKRRISSDGHPSSPLPAQPLDMVNDPAAATDTTYTTPTGVVVNLSQAGFVLSNYLQSFGGDPSDFRICSTFTVIPSPSSLVQPKRPLKPEDSHQPPPDSLFHCTITLPPPCPLRTMSSPGQGYRSKDTAKKHAQIEFIKALVQLGEIGSDLKPTPSRKKRGLATKKQEEHYERQGRRLHRRLSSPLTPPDPATVAEKAKTFSQAIIEGRPSRTIPLTGVVPGQAEHVFFSHATFWDACTPFTKDNLWPTVFELQLGPPFEDRNRECRKLCLITTQPFPFLEEGQPFDVNTSFHVAGTGKDEVNAGVRLTRGQRLKKWDEAKLQEAMIFTQRLVRANVQKPLAATLQTTKWILVPLSPDYETYTGDAFKVKRRNVAWNEVSRVAEAIHMPFTFDDPDVLEKEIVDAMTTARYEFARRHYITKLRRDLTPASKDPYHADKTILETSKATTELKHPGQNILEGEQVHLTRSGGFIASLLLPNLQGKLAIPELTHRHTIPASVFKTSSVLPVLLQQIDDNLIAHELNQTIFKGSLRPDFALMAISSPTIQTDPLRSYQRLEMLGDTLLKFLVAVFHLHKVEKSIDWDYIHQQKQIMVSNRTLMVRAIESGITPFIRGTKLKPRDWVPLGWKEEPMPAKGADNTNEVSKKVDEGHTRGTALNDPCKEAPGNPHSALRQLLGDKTIADVAEALVGASYLSSDSNLDAAISTMHILGMPVPGFHKWSDITTSATTGPKNGSATEGAVKPPPLVLLQYHFVIPENGRDAMSFATDFARRSKFMKFKVLGDAVLDYCLIEDLYHRHPDCGPGELTVMRHSRHGDASLAAFAVTSGLIDQVTDVPFESMTTFQRFKKELMARKKTADLAKNAASKLEFWADISSIADLGELVNALLGSILVDAGYNIETVWTIYREQFFPFFETYCTGPTLAGGAHPRTAWSQMISKRGCQKWELRKEPKTEWGLYPVTMYLHDQIVGHAEADSQTVAIRKACEEALKVAKSLDTICTCPKRKKGRGGSPE